MHVGFSETVRQSSRGVSYRNGCNGCNGYNGRGKNFAAGGGSAAGKTGEALQAGQRERAGKAASGAEFVQSVNQAREARRESVVDSYIEKHPNDAAHVNSQVNAGKRVLLRNGANQVSREDMTMAEYQDFIMGLLHGIPFDASRVGDKEFIDITDEGWEQMKNDSAYEAWVLGYTVENRSVQNPFAGWPGVSPNLCVEHFGASIEEHLGQSMPMHSSGIGSSDEEEEESWWDKRHKRMKKLLEEQVKEALVKRRATQDWEMQEYHRAAMESRQRMAEFLNGSTTVGTGMSMQGQALSQAVAAAIAAYDSSILMSPDSI